MPSPQLSVVIPAYNEQHRLPSTLQRIQQFVERQHLDCEIIVVDNGSSDATSAIVNDVMRRCAFVALVRTERRGKGLAVREGVRAARGDIVVLADADLSWSVDDLVRIPRLISDEVPIAIGLRGDNGSHEQYEPLCRRLMSRVFNLIVRGCVVHGFRDTQCGFKVLRLDVARKIFACETIDGFGFDIELLFLARRFGYSVAEVPLIWHHKDGSRVHPIFDVVKMLGDVGAVRWNALLGRYPTVVQLGR